jgi:hypothetical protein
MSGELIAGPDEVFVIFADTGPQGPPGQPSPEVFSLSRPGQMAVAPGTLGLPLSGSYTLIDYRVRWSTAPLGADGLVDINKNGTSLFTTQENRPKILDGQQDASTTAPDITTFVSGDYITVDVDQVGSSVAGSDMTVVLRMQRTS